MINRKAKGYHYENRAQEWLESQGLSPVTRNYSCRFGEIDLIMLDEDCLCFIEVKYRESMDFGGSAYALPVSKQRKLERSALDFISRNQKYRNHAMRFDALLIQANAGGDPSFNWISNAFYSE
jgi:putative endonuclease